jgi:threonine dehydrogenase-like Zn-dependent dehydrogenase
LVEAERTWSKVINLNNDHVAKIKAATDGRGADISMEIVGHTGALMLSLDLIRPWGQISSIGVHTEKLELNDLMLYGKKVTLSFGRCPMRSIFEEALELLLQQEADVAFLCGKTMLIGILGRERCTRLSSR